MFKYFIVVTFSVISNIFSQQIKISTEFSKNGSLLASVYENAQILADFNENDECAILGYLGKDIYKINYKDFLGFVKAEYLIVNDEMIEVVIAYEDKLKMEAIEKESQRKKEVEELVRKSEEERHKKEQEELLIKMEEEERIERIKQDSIIKSIEKEKQKREQKELARIKQEAMNKLRREDSIVGILKLENRHKEPEVLISNLENDKMVETIAENRNEKINTKTQLHEEELKEKQRLANMKFRNTCHYLQNEFDKLYFVKIIHTTPYQISKNLTIELYNKGQDKQVFFNSSENLGCASYMPSNRSYAKVNLENKDIIIFYHLTFNDCGKFSLKSSLSSSDIEKLKKSPIKSIILEGTKKSLEIKNIDYKEFFIDKLTCID